MKLVCDICGGELEMEVGGKRAKCVNCGMTYSIERLKEKLNPNENREKINERKVEHENVVEKTPLRIRIDKVGGSIFSKDCVIEGTILSGELRSRDIIGIEGEKKSYTVSYTNPINKKSNVRIVINQTSKKEFAPGQILVKSYAVDDYFRKILARHFREIEVQEDVEIVDDGVNVNFILIKNGQPKLAIILCNSRVYNSKAIRQTIDACEASGVVVQRYFRDFENEESYVCQRIGSVL